MRLTIIADTCALLSLSLSGLLLKCEFAIALFSAVILSFLVVNP
jgi:hypothetical protein